MWAILSDNKVIGYTFNLEEKNLKINKHNIFIQMTEENSPAVIGDYYDGKTFNNRMELIWKHLQYFHNI